MELCLMVFGEDCAFVRNVWVRFLDSARGNTQQMPRGSLYQATIPM